jgi:hypothetical protein
LCPGVHCFVVMLIFTLVGLLAWPTAAAAQAALDPFAFFRPSIVVTPAERARLDQGDSLVRVLPAADDEVAIFAAVAVNVDGDRLVDWVQQIEQLKKSPFVSAIGRFSDPPVLGDLAGLELADADLDDLQGCRPGDCGLKLSAPEIRRLGTPGAGTGETWRRGAQDVFRRLVLDRVQDYLAGGYAALPPYADRSREVSLQVTLSDILRRSVYLTEHLPEFGEYLGRYPKVAAPGVQSFIYWSKEMLGGRAIISATHVSVLRPACDSLPEVLVAGQQVFATHYMNGSLNVTAIMPGGSAPRRYLVYLNRSRVDILGGWFGGLVRLIVERRLKAEASEVLQGLRRRLESGEPPAGRSRIDP